MAGFADLIPEQNPSVVAEDIVKIQGTSWNHGWTVADGAGALVDFTGGTAKMQIRDESWNLIGTWTETQTAGRRIVLANGSVSITATPAGTSTLYAFGLKEYSVNFYYDLEVTVAGETVSFASGQFTIKRDVTT